MSLYLPKEIWECIYSFDSTYHEIYGQCLQEMTAHFNYNRTICLLNSLFIQNVFHNNDHLFGNDVYHNINIQRPNLIQYIKRFMNNRYYRNADTLRNNLDHYRYRYNANPCCEYCKSIKHKLYTKPY